MSQGRWILPERESTAGVTLKRLQTFGEKTMLPLWSINTNFKSNYTRRTALSKAWTLLKGRNDKHYFWSPPLGTQFLVRNQTVYAFHKREDIHTHIQNTSWGSGVSLAFHSWTTNIVSSKNPPITDIIQTESLCWWIFICMYMYVCSESCWIKKPWI